MTVYTYSILDNELLTEITPKLLGPFPNTYSYTKSVGERLVANEIGSIPCAIVRPSIVCPSIQEPFEARYSIFHFENYVFKSAARLVNSVSTEPRTNTRIIGKVAFSAAGPKAFTHSPSDLPTN